MNALVQLTIAFKKLSVFHQPSELSPETVTLPSSDVAGPLLPFKVMAKEIDIRFRYHFEGSRATNNIEKVSHLQVNSRQPEWFFQSILTTLQTHKSFMNDEIQPILNEIGLKRSALTEFITALLPILHRKVGHLIPDILKNGSLLSHFMHENLVFDTTLREEYLYVPFGESSWEGSIQHSLKAPRIFKTWLDTEKDCTPSGHA